MKNLESLFIDWVFIPLYLALRFCIMLTIWPLLAWQEREKGEKQREYLDDHFVMLGFVIIVFGIATGLVRQTSLIGFFVFLYLVVGIITDGGYKKEFGRSFL